MLESGVLGGGECRVAGLLHEADGLAGNIHVVADVGLVLRGNRLEHLVERHFVVQVFDQFAQRKNGVGLKLLGADVVGDLGAGVGAENAILVHMPVEDVAGLFGGGDEVLHLAGVTAWLRA